MKYCISIVLILSLLISYANAEPLPSIDQALTLMKTTNDDRIEVSPSEFEDYDPENHGEIDYGNLKIIVLQRQFPEKEFTELDSRYPNMQNYIEGFPDDFSGIDIGKSRLWLRCDIMKAFLHFFVLILLRMLIFIWLQKMNTGGPEH